MGRKPASTLVYAGSLAIERGAVPYEVRAERRRDTRFSLTARRGYARVPRGLGREAVARVVAEFESWLARAVARRPDLAAAHRPIDYADGDVWRLGAHAFRLRIAGGPLKGASAKTTGPADAGGIVPLAITLPPAGSPAERSTQVERLLYRMAARRARPRVEALLDELNDAHFRVDVHRLKLSPTRTRWGSCSATGTISISSRLLGAPEEVLRAVLVHELAHRLEMNHSARFWALVRGAMPAYDRWDGWLRREGGELGWVRDPRP